MGLVQQHLARPSRVLQRRIVCNLIRSTWATPHPLAQARMIPPVNSQYGDMLVLSTLLCVAGEHRWSCGRV